MKIIIQLIFALVALILFVGILAIGMAYYLNAPPELENPEALIFEVKKGEPVSAIADRLKKKAIIRSSLLLRIISKLENTEKKFKIGNYRIDADKTTLEVHNLLVSGKEILKQVTIPEGWTSSRIAEYLENEGITGKEAFLHSIKDTGLLKDYRISGGTAEGFLYPDTYRFAEDYPAEKVVRHMVANFYENLETIYPKYKEMTREDIVRKVILSSIVEREYRRKDEAAIIASVFENRLDRSMRLESCATVGYVISEELGMPYPKTLTIEDTNRNSEYNTYIHKGLPPAPICNPGKVALKASFEPEETEYLFFLLKDPETGEHFFSSSYKDHNRAKSLYLKSIPQR